MTAIAHALPAQRLFSATVVRLFSVEFAAMSSFYLLLSVVPLFSGDRGIGGAGAGLSTGVLMIAAVAGEMVVPGLAARFGYRTLLICGLVLLGAPALALPTVTGIGGLMAVSVLRGLGFAVVVVTVGAMVALAIPKQRQGEGMGALGVAAMLPAVIALPLGVWLVGQVGYAAVFGVAGALALVAVVLVPHGAEPDHSEGGGLFAGLRGRGMARPILVFTAASVAGGVVVAFLPGAVTEGVAVAGLFAQSALATLVRWLAGRYCDKYGAARLLPPAVVLCACGMGLAALTQQGWAVLAGMAVFGAGYGLAQSASLNAMLQRASRTQYGAVNAAWNAAYDLGWGAGALAIGVVVSGAGYPMAFAATALVVLAALPAACRVKGQPREA